MNIIKNDKRYILDLINDNFFVIDTVTNNDLKPIFFDIKNELCFVIEKSSGLQISIFITHNDIYFANKYGLIKNCDLDYTNFFDKKLQPKLINVFCKRYFQLKYMRLVGHFNEKFTIFHVEVCDKFSETHHLDMWSIGEVVRNFQLKVCIISRYTSVQFIDNVSLNFRW
uniref:Uncharacterized protein n=1 Tax=Nesodiprion zhejiangensis nucleopolyhedrovirus TaxID=3135970 RepID=A0AAN0LMB7_9BACU